MRINVFAPSVPTAPEADVSNQDSTLVTFRHQARTAQADHAFESFLALLPARGASARLQGDDTHLLCQVLHNQCRHGRDKQPAARKALRERVDLLIRLLQEKKTPPHPMASLHLLGYFRDSRQYDAGRTFWESWLVHQNEASTDAGTWGAAIELLTEDQEPLVNLEAMYTHGLRHFCGDFAEYHFSPEAILADRSSASSIGRLRLHLIQGIAFARLHRGDWRNAYLALDTMLRVYPDQLPRKVFDMFVSTRALSEAYTAMMLGYRTGTAMAPATLRKIHTRMIALQSSTAPWPTNFWVALAMLNVLHAHIGSGSPWDDGNSAIMLRGILGMLYRMPNPLPDEKGTGGHPDVQKAVDNVVVRVMRIFDRLGVPSSASLVSASIITMGARLRRPDMVAAAHDRLLREGVQTDTASYRALVQAGAMLGEASMMRQGWNLIEQFAATRTDSHRPGIPAPNDWRVLIQAGSVVNDLTLAQAQVEKYWSVMSKQQQRSVSHQMHEVLERSGRLHEPGNASAHVASGETAFTSDEDQNPMQRSGDDTNEADYNLYIESISARLDEIEDLVDSEQLQDFSRERIPMGFAFPELQMSAAELEEAYDTYTTETRHAAPGTEGGTSSSDASTSGEKTEKRVPDDGQQGQATKTLSRGVRTAAGYRLADLRFENWKTLNELLLAAEINSGEGAGANKEARHVEGRTLQSTDLDKADKTLDWLRVIGGSVGGVKNGSSSTGSVGDGRRLKALEVIRRLRGPARQLAA
ncbi:MAG: hypothetical protein M1817_002143 [Caeruleum heppii]|nr:MAG: hypothetical protein M1817_002143 [Caeruleum heppii]